MNLHHFVGENWNQTFAIWIDGIHVLFLPPKAQRKSSGGLLARVRLFTNWASAFILPFFCLHCAQLQASVIADTLPSPLCFAPKPAVAVVYAESGLASWYGGQGDGFSGNLTANGEVLDPGALTCAHRTLPFNTLIEVENMDSNKRVVLRVNDRGPYLRGRVLDVSLEAARQLGFLAYGTARVTFREVTRTEFSQSKMPVQMDALAETSSFGFFQQALEMVFGPSSWQQSLGFRGNFVKRVKTKFSSARTEVESMPDESCNFFFQRDPFIIRRRA